MDAAAESFWGRVDTSGECWLWTGARLKTGYGVLKRGGRVLKASRVAWALVKGPIPDGLFVCHHCDNPPCVRPDHLFLGTHLDNMRDRDAKGRNVQTARTHCRRGHEYSIENTRHTPNGRRCRACHQASLEGFRVKRVRTRRDTGARVPVPRSPERRDANG